MTDLFDIIASEIEAIERRWRTLLRHSTIGSILPARWSLSGEVLRWHVLIAEEVIEADIDVEITAAALIVRATLDPQAPEVLLRVLPVPHGFDHFHPDIRLSAGTLQVSLRRIEEESR